jgi:hypothetical protein
MNLRNRCTIGQLSTISRVFRRDELACMFTCSRLDKEKDLAAISPVVAKAYGFNSVRLLWRF